MVATRQRPILASRPAALLAAAALACAGAAAQGPPPEPSGTEPPAVSAAAAPALVVPQRVIDLGTVVRGEKREARFALNNEGDATLRILRAKPG
jgi:hypothetical protein